MSMPPNYSNGPDQPGYPAQGHPPPQGYPPQQGYAPPQGYPPQPGYPGGPPQKNSNIALIIGGVVLLLALIAAGAFLLSGSGDDASSYAASTAPASAATAPAAASPPLDGATTPPPGAVSAPAAASSRRRYANSPDDGFLSLRSNPNASSGSRLAQIPHGAAVDVGSCSTSDTVGGVSGRWCSATYDGRSGYVFDAYLASSQPAPRTASSAPSGSGGSRPTPGPTYEQESTFQVTGASAFSVRTHPSINAPRAGTIPRNGTFNSERCEVNARREGGTSRTWCYVNGGGVVGWASVDNNFVTVIAG